MLCIQCGSDKELNEKNFYFKLTTQKWGSRCKRCISTNGKRKYLEQSEELKSKTAAYRSLNRDAINLKAILYNKQKEIQNRTTKWRQENRKHLRKKEKEWRLANPEKHKEIVRRKAQRQRQKPSSKIKAHVSRQINFALSRVGNSKQGNSVLQFLPYTISDLKDHLEGQFEPWMTWNNYGTYKEINWVDNDKSTWTWQIDHITPQSYFSYSSMKDDDFQRCWALDNLRPYSSKQNLLDGSNRTRHK
jgi:hypothetical protein